MIYVFQTTEGCVIEVDGATLQEARRKAERVRRDFGLKGQLQ